MTTRKWTRLRGLAEPLLVPAGAAESATEASGPSGRETLTVSLTKHGLWIPRTNVERARAVLASLGDVEIQCENEWGNGVELLIGRGVSLSSVLVALEVDVDTIDPVSPSTKREYLSSLRAEFRKLDQTLRTAS
jgi:hypothetical protein